VKPEEIADLQLENQELHTTISILTKLIKNRHDDLMDARIEIRSLRATIDWMREAI